MGKLDIGSAAPDFQAATPDGTPTRLSEHRGRYVLVYFYPKDFTGGCTAEACSLNDSLEDLSACGADVIGVSGQDEASHAKFQMAHGLRFALAADTDRTIADQYGVGRMLGILPLHSRESFLVGPDGTIVTVWRQVNPTTHAADVLAAVKGHAATAAR